MIEAQQRSLISIKPIVAALYLFSIWDFYILGLGVRPFDIIGLLVLIIYFVPKLALLPSERLLDTGEGKTVLLFVLFGLAFTYAAVGVVNDSENIKPAFGFIAGTAVFTLLYQTKINNVRGFIKAIDALLFIHSAYLILQFAFFYTTGQVLNIHKQLGGEPRALGAIFRPTGLLLEPANYSFTVVTLLVLKKHLTPKVGFLGLVALATVFLSLSTWGIVAGALFILFNKWNKMSLVVFTILLSVVAIQRNSLQETEAFLSFDRRLKTLEVDPSTQARYQVGIENIRDGKIPMFTLLFGDGINNENITFGSNGLGFMLNSFGLIGTFVFLLTLFLLIAPSNKFRTTFSVLLLLTAAPLWSHFYWWAGLALITRKFPSQTAQTCA